MWKLGRAGLHMSDLREEVLLMRIQKRVIDAGVPPMPPKYICISKEELLDVIRIALAEYLGPLMTEDDVSECSTPPASTEQKLTLSVEEAARKIGISRPKMLELLHDGEIPHRRVGRKIIISNQTLVNWLNEE